MFTVSFLIFIAGSFLIRISQCGNNYQIFYNFPGYEQILPIDLDSDDTVKDAIQKISQERKIITHKGYYIQLNFKGDVLEDRQPLSDAGIGPDSLVSIIIILHTPTELILKAFSNTNFLELIRLRGFSLENCCKWNPFITCDENGHPIEIFISERTRIIFQGSFDFSVLPDTIQQINFHGSVLSGTIDFTQMPRDLREFALGGTQFAADFSSMRRDRWPKQLQHIDWFENDLFSGHLNCGELPRSLIVLDIARSKHLNHITFNNLPPNITDIYLNDNVLHGLDLSYPLPEFLKMINIDYCTIAGEIKLQGIRNCTSLTFECDSKMRPVLQRIAHKSEVSINFSFM